MKSETLTARPRAERGTRACRKLRLQGEIPASLYGTKKGADGKTQLENYQLAVSAWSMMQLIDHHHTVVTVAFDGRKELAILKEVQRDTFGDDVLHVDLEMIDKDTPVETEVELVFKGDAKGVKEGGTFQAQLHNLEIKALPLAIPENIIVNVTDLGLDQTIYVRDLKLPEGIEAVAEPDQVVVHIVPPAGEAAEAEEGLEGAAPAEPEVIGRKKEEEEGGD